MGKIKSSPFLTIARRETRKKEQLTKTFKRGQKIWLNRNGVREFGWFVADLTLTNIKVVNQRGMLESVPKAAICEDDNANRDTERDGRPKQKVGNQTNP